MSTTNDKDNASASASAGASASATATATATARSKRKMFEAQSQSRVELAAQLSGLGASFEQAAQLGPQIADLQAALLGGLQRSQELEAQRLADRHGKEDARVLEAVARSERFSALQTEVEAKAGIAAHVADTFTADGLFHGYVVQADGSDAVGYGVRLTLLDAASGRVTLRKAAKTDAEGYFRIALHTDTGTTPKNPGHDVQDLVDRVARAIAQDDGAPAAHAAAAATADAAASVAETSQVEVFDTEGKLVHEDPMPPRFDGLASEFRYYVLGVAKAAGGGKKADSRQEK